MSRSKFEAREASQQIMVNMEPAWVREVRHNMEMSRQLKYPTKPSIFRVPSFIRSSNPDAYEPQLVSIGPYHHGKSNLQAMEKMKWRILDHLLSRASKDSIQQCLQKMQELEPESRSWYSEAIDMESHKFAEMLMLDGCFIIGLCSDILLETELHHAMVNSVFTQVRVLEDLLLIENQLPYFIFKHLLGVLDILELEDVFPIRRPMLMLFDVLLPHLNLRVSPSPEPNEEVSHLLHLLHKSILKRESKATPSVPRSRQASSLTGRNQDFEPRLLHLLHGRNLRTFFSIGWKKKGKASRPDSGTSKKSLFVVPSATDLVEAGIKIRVRKADYFLNISFDKGVLHIPAIHVDDYTNLIFRNLIAWEQFRNDLGMDITFYSSFMDSIINTERDVALLSRERIIYNGLGSEKDIASMFNELCKGVTFVPGRNSLLAGLSREVNAYYDSRWNRWRAKLMNDYFSNPWTIISVIAATVLLGLTLVQTLFSVLSYAQQIHGVDRPRP